MCLKSLAASANTMEIYLQRKSPGEARPRCLKTVAAWMAPRRPCSLAPLHVLGSRLAVGQSGAEWAQPVLGAWTPSTLLPGRQVSRGSPGSPACALCQRPNSELFSALLLNFQSPLLAPCSAQGERPWPPVLLALVWGETCRWLFHGPAQNLALLVCF